jgi:hypothetical protein
MIRFYDLDTRKVFNGSQPYVFNLGGGASTGKWVSEPLIIVSDSDTLDISFPSDSLFKIAQLSDPETVDINSHEYIDLDSISCSQCTVQGADAGNGMYLFKTNILFMTDTEGEFHDFLTIDSGEPENFEFAVDAYGEDERLPIDVANLGFEIPKQFQRAVYETNLRDESEDHILLNRKWKELLIEYWNVLANKGSYDSLINSIKFFEYGDLVKISEYWRYIDNFDNELLVGRDLEQLLSEEIKQYLDVLTKTTYIGLNMLVNGFSEGDYVKYPEGTLQLDPDKFIPEPVPQLEYLALKWSIDDLTLKMTLLANYFSTYFMPIHLDLIHATVDRLVFTNCIKILRGFRRRREDWWDDQLPILCNLSFDDTYWIGNEHSYNYPDTVLRNSDLPTYWGDLTRIGIDPLVENRITFSEENTDEIRKYLNQYFGGVGVVVPVNCEFKKHNFIKSSRISVYHQEDESNYELVATYLSYEPLTEDSLDFNLLFVVSGRYLIELQLTDVDGSTRTGSWYITVNGKIGNAITVKRLRKIDYPTVSEEKQFDDWFYDNLDFNSFMFTEPFADQIKYKQWIVPTDGYEIDGVGMNQLLVIDCGLLGTERDIELTCNGETKEFQFSLDIAQELAAEYPHYWWKLLTRNTARASQGEIEITEDLRYYIVGVRKHFDTEEEDTRELFSDYVKIYKEGELEDLDVVLVNHVCGRNGRGYLQVTAPVGTDIWVDSMHFDSTTQTTTIPLLKERYHLTIEYRIGGHLFRKEVQVDDMMNQYGTTRYIVHSAKQKGFTTIEESRFFPIFHKLEDIEQNKIKMTDTAVCLPDFRWCDKQVTDTRWEFVNATTGEIIYSKSFKEFKDSGDPLYIEEPFIGKYDFKNSLTRGYYDIVLHFTMGGTEQEETVVSAFRIE